MSISFASDRAPKRVRGFDDQRASILFVGVAYLALSAPQALNFFRLLPVEAVLLMVALHLARGARRSSLSIRVPAIALGLVAWFGLTVFWSDGRGITIVQTAATALALTIAVIVGTFCTFRSLVRGVLLGGLLVLGLSVLVAVASPSTGLMPAGYKGGSLRGIYVHRNILAAVLSVSFAAALAADHGGRHPRVRWAFGVGAILAGVLLTQSSTSVATCLAVAGVGAFLWLTRRLPIRWRLLTLLGSVAVVSGLAWLAATNTSVVFKFLQRDDTLTGRTLIWEAVGNLIARQPLGGYGWGATWNPTDRVASYVSAFSKFEVPSAHNGYLDAWVQVGIIGLAGLVLLLLTVLLRGSGALLHTNSRLASFAPLLVTALIVHNISETNIVDSGVLFLLVATLTRLLVHRRSPDSTIELVAPLSRQADLTVLSLTRAGS